MIGKAVWWGEKWRAAPAQNPKTRGGQNLLSRLLFLDFCKREFAFSPQVCIKNFLLHTIKTGGFMEKKFIPGEDVPETGDYRAYDRNGKKSKGQTYLEKGETFPPTQHEGSYYEKERER